MKAKEAAGVIAAAAAAAGRVDTADTAEPTEPAEPAKRRSLGAGGTTVIGTARMANDLARAAPLSTPLNRPLAPPISFRISRPNVDEHRGRKLISK